MILRQISRKHIPYSIKNVTYFSGFLTSRETLMSLLHLLAENPEIQRKMQEEIDDVIGEREVNIEDRGSCPFTEAVLLETLRLISHLPLGAPHLTADNCTIRGKMVKEGTIVRLNFTSPCTCSYNLLSSETQDRLHFFYQVRPTVGFRRWLSTFRMGRSQEIPGRFF